MRFSFYKLRMTQTITQISTMVPISPYPNIVALCRKHDSRIQNNDKSFCTVSLAMYVQFGTQMAA